MRSASTARVDCAEIGVEDDQEDGAGADEDRDVERYVGAPVVVDIGKRLDHRDRAEDPVEIGDRGKRTAAVGKRDLEDPGAGAEGGERLGFADDAGERDVLFIDGARRRRDHRAGLVADVDAPSVAGRARRQRIGKHVQDVEPRRWWGGAGLELVERSGKRARDHAHRLARLIFAFDS